VGALGAGWDGRLYVGLAVPCVPAPARSALTRALGEAGVEAEFFLALIQSFPPSAWHTHAQGEILLLQLEAAAYRISRVAAALEVATQGFLAGLASGYPDLRRVGELDEVWWPTFTGFVPGGDPLDLRLRRCGFAYRHLVEVHLAATIESIAEQMAFTLHALQTLPPVGVVPAGALYQGLYELSSAWQGDIVQNHLLDVGAEAPGLLTAIGRLRALDTSDDTSLESDLAWAHAQVGHLRGTLSPRGAGARAAERAMRDWHDTIVALDRLRQSSQPFAR
jgi:hypothetical protein